MAPFVSVVIPTIGRGELLKGTLSGVLGSDYPDFEVIVVDQTPETDASVIELVEKNRDRVKYIHVDEPGLPNARNIGIEAANGDVILFLDDDVVVGGALIGAHAKSYVEDCIGGVAGRILPPGDGPIGFERNPKKIAKMKLFGLLVYDNFNSDVPTRAHHTRGCNMSFRREALIRGGGFDTGFGGSAHLEETDMAIRVRDLGYEIIFEPEASLVHLLEPVGGCRPKDMREWFFWYGHNFCLFYRKNYPIYLFPIYIVYFFCKLPFSAIKRGDMRAVFWGLSGFLNCLFRKRITRLDVFE